MKTKEDITKQMIDEEYTQKIPFSIGVIIGVILCGLFMATALCYTVAFITMSIIDKIAN